MDRMYKCVDKVHVYRSLAEVNETKHGKLPTAECIKTFKQQEYAFNGLSNYKYEDRMYMGFQRWVYNSEGISQPHIFICLDKPLLDFPH